MSKPSSLRIVISARPVMKADELAGAELAGLVVQVHRVGGEEQVPLIPVELGALVLMLGVLDRERVQAELLAEHREIVVVRVQQIEPDDSGRRPVR